MDTNATGTCCVCGGAGGIRVTEIRGGTTADRVLCAEHAPAEMRDQMPFGPDPMTPAQQFERLHQRLSALIRKESEGMTWNAADGAAQRAEREAERKQLVAEIEALRPQIGDVITDVAALRRRQAGDADSPPTVNPTSRQQKSTTARD